MPSQLRHLALIAAVLFGASLGIVSSAPAATASGTFLDIGGNIHEVMIEEIAALGVTKGCDPEGTLYCPARVVNRGQMASFLVRALDLPSAGDDYFTDDNGTTHEDNINRLVEAGIALGFTDGTFRPELPISRAQMASFVARGFSDYLIPGKGDWFSDDDGTAHEGSINTLAANAITFGCDSLSAAFCPDMPIRRDQLASLLGRLIGTPWSFATVDAGGGRLPSMVMGADGLPLIAYYNDEGVSVAHCEVPTCASVQITQLHGPGKWGSVSLALFPDGTPMIVWNSGSPVYATRCLDASCTTFESPHKIADHLAMRTGQALTIGADGNPVVVGYRATGATPLPPIFLTETELSVLRCLDPECSEVDQHALDTNAGEITGPYASVAIGSDGLPIIAYQRDFGPMIHGFLRVAHCRGVECLSATVESPANGYDPAGYSTSIAIGVDGLPIISVRTLYDGNVVVIHCDDLNCTTASETTHSYEEIGSGPTSIAIDASGLPTVAYSGWRMTLGYAVYEPILAECSDTACSQLSLNRLTDPTIEGGDVSLAYDQAGRAVIAYWNTGTGTLDLARSGHR
jgi:hypothetical protein